VNCDYSEMVFNVGREMSLANKQAKTKGWKLTFEDGVWQNLCPSCIDLKVESGQRLPRCY